MLQIYIDKLAKYKSLCLLGLSLLCKKKTAVLVVLTTTNMLCNAFQLSFCAIPPSNV